MEEHILLIQLVEGPELDLNLSGKRLDDNVVRIEGGKDEDGQNQDAQEKHQKEESIEELLDIFNRDFVLQTHLHLVLGDLQVDERVLEFEPLVEVQRGLSDGPVKNGLDLVEEGYVERYFALEVLQERDVSARVSEVVVGIAEFDLDSRNDQVHEENGVDHLSNLEVGERVFVELGHLEEEEVVDVDDDYSVNQQLESQNVLVEEGLLLRLLILPHEVDHVFLFLGDLENEVVDHRVSLAIAESVDENQGEEFENDDDHVFGELRFLKRLGEALARANQDVVAENADDEYRDFEEKKRLVKLLPAFNEQGFAFELLKRIVHIHDQDVLVDFSG